MKCRSSATVQIGLQALFFRSAPPAQYFRRLSPITNHQSISSSQLPMSRWIHKWQPRYVLEPSSAYPALSTTCPQPNAASSNHANPQQQRNLEGKMLAWGSPQCGHLCLRAFAVLIYHSTLSSHEDTFCFSFLYPWKMEVPNQRS